MNNKKLSKIREEFNIITKRIAKKQMKENPKLKKTILDIKDHFKTKNPWPISYSYYLFVSGVNELIFNQVLLMLNMKIYFCKVRQSIVFKKEMK